MSHDVTPAVRATIKAIESQMEKYGDNTSSHDIDSGMLSNFLKASDEIGGQIHYVHRGGESYLVTVERKGSVMSKKEGSRNEAILPTS